MNERTQINLDRETQRRAREKAAQLGISFAEYVRRLLARDLSDQIEKLDISAVFALDHEGPATDVAREKDKMVGDAVWLEHQRDTGSLRRRSRGKTKRA
jgi:hypothetical protein